MKIHPALLRHLAVAVLSAGFFVASAHATNQTVDTAGEKSSGFTTGTFAPFSTCTTLPVNAGILTTFQGQPCIQFTWHEANYNGTRTARGTEACSPLQIQKEAWFGFYLYLPDPGYPLNKEAGVAQWFANNSACSSWTGMLIMRNNDLIISHRSFCGTPTDGTVVANFPRNRWVSIIAHVVASHLNAGQFEIFIDGVSKYSASKINFGFDKWTADDALQSPVNIGLKIGQYDYDESHFDPGETRTSYYTNVTQILGNPSGILEYIRLPVPGAQPPPPAPPPPAAPEPPAASSRLVNLSTRSLAGEGSSTQIAGLIVTGTANRKVLIRAGGPYLTQFGVSGALSNPVLTLYEGAVALATNDDWGTDGAAIAAASVKAGVVPFTGGSQDAALIATLRPGVPYTAMVTGKSGATGIAIIEVYDVDDGAASSLSNISTRSFVGPGAQIQIAGFILQGTGSRKVLIRAGGPYLTQFGVGDVLADPVLTVFKDQTQLAQNDDWSTVAAEVDAAQKSAGVVSFATGSKDAALVLTLDSGVPYTVQVTGKNGASGNGLVELYAVP